MSARSLRVKSLPCIACLAWDQVQHTPTEEHHLNLGGKAGQKRRGDKYSIPLCSWHHRSDRPDWISAKDADFYWGPSLARQPKKFRECYGTDDELLDRTNKLLETLNVDA